MIPKCDCGTSKQALVWCHIHGYINHPKPLPLKKKPSPEPPPKKASK